jgi:hypothetical protein
MPGWDAVRYRVSTAELTPDIRHGNQPSHPGRCCRLNLLSVLEKSRVGESRSRTPDPETLSSVTDLRTFARRAQARGRAAIRLSGGPTRRRVAGSLAALWFDYPNRGASVRDIKKQTPGPRQRRPSSFGRTPTSERTPLGTSPMICRLAARCIDWIVATYGHVTKLHGRQAARRPSSLLPDSTRETGHLS